jgi:hypothetical protein
MISHPRSTPARTARPAAAFSRALGLEHSSRGRHPDTTHDHDAHQSHRPQPAAPGHSDQRHGCTVCCRWDDSKPCTHVVSHAPAGRPTGCWTLDRPRRDPLRLRLTRHSPDRDFSRLSPRLGRPPADVPSDGTSDSALPTTPPPLPQPRTAPARLDLQSARRAAGLGRAQSSAPSTGAWAPALHQVRWDLGACAWHHLGTAWRRGGTSGRSGYGQDPPGAAPLSGTAVKDLERLFATVVKNPRHQVPAARTRPRPRPHPPHRHHLLRLKACAPRTRR